MVPVIVILLITGCVFLLESFLFKDAFSDDSKRKIMTETEIEQLVERRFSEVKDRLDDEAEKSADVIRDQTERESQNEAVSGDPDQDEDDPEQDEDAALDDPEADSDEDEDESEDEGQGFSMGM